MVNHMHRAKGNGYFNGHPMVPTFSQQHLPLTRNFDPSENWLSSRYLTSVMTWKLVFPFWYKPLLPTKAVYTSQFPRNYYPAWFFLPFDMLLPLFFKVSEMSETCQNLYSIFDKFIISKPCQNSWHQIMYYYWEVEFVTVETWNFYAIGSDILSISWTCQNLCQFVVIEDHQKKCVGLKPKE